MESRRLISEVLAINYHRIIIVGGGLTGLITAELLKEYNPLIIEKESKAGGMAKSFYQNGYIFDYGGHYLHFDNKEQFDFFNKFSNNLIKKTRKSFIYTGNKLIPYPIQIHFSKFFPNLKEKVISEIENSKIDSSNYYNYLKTTFGETLFNLFFYPYNTKFWKTKLTEMDIEWTEKLIPKINTDLIENPINNVGYNYELYYPENGISEISENLAKDKNMVLNERLDKIDTTAKIVYTDKNSYKYDIIITTIPIYKLLLKTDMMRFDMESLSVKILNIGIKGDCPEDFSWIYLPEDNTPFFRLGKYIVPENKGNFALYFEHSYKEEPLSDNVLLEEAKKLIKEFNMDNKIETYMFLELKHAYPILKTKEKGYLPIVFQQLYKKNIFPAGRMGSWKYISMNDSYEEAKRIKKIIENRIS